MTLANNNTISPPSPSVPSYDDDDEDEKRFDNQPEGSPFKDSDESSEKLGSIQKSVELISEEYDIDKDRLENFLESDVDMYSDTLKIEDRKKLNNQPEKMRPKTQEVPLSSISETENLVPTPEEIKSFTIWALTGSGLMLSAIMFAILSNVLSLEVGIGFGMVLGILSIAVLVFYNNVRRKSIK